MIPTPDDADAHQQRVAKLSDRVEELQRELAAKSSEFHLQLANWRRTSADLRRLLPAGTTLVDLVEYFDNLAASKGRSIRRFGSSDWWLSWFGRTNRSIGSS